MTTKELLISRLNLLSEEDIASLLDAATHMEEKIPSLFVTGCAATMRFRGLQTALSRTAMTPVQKTPVSTT